MSRTKQIPTTGYAGPTSESIPQPMYYELALADSAGNRPSISLAEQSLISHVVTPLTLHDSVNALVTKGIDLPFQVTISQLKSKAKDRRPDDWNLCPSAEISKTPCTLTEQVHHTLAGQSVEGLLDETHHSH